MTHARRAFVFLTLAVGPLLVAAGPAAAGESALLLKAEVGRGADPAVVAAVQRQVEAWLKQDGVKVELGQATLTDTAAIAGCSLDEPSCAGQITATVGVDQLVAVKIERTALGHRVRVTRVRGATPEVSTFELASGDAARIDAAIAAGLRGEAGGSGGGDGGGGAGPGAGGGPPPGPSDGVGAGGGSPGGEAGVGPTDALGQPGAGDGGGAGPGGLGGPAPAAQTEGGGGVSRRGLQIGGMITGGVLAVAGVSFWIKASSINGDIAAAPTQTASDFRDLVVLEEDAASAATWGNILTVAGVLIGGGSAYWWYRTRGDAPTTPTAAWAPFVAPTSGGGVAGVRWGVAR